MVLADPLHGGEQAVDDVAGVVGFGGQGKRTRRDGQDRSAVLHDASRAHPVAGGAQRDRGLGLVVAGAETPFQPVAEDHRWPRRRPPRPRGRCG
ncbi:hypothetical protein [Nonomuraea sp. NEAU-A123]|uniref:hypothetical protein n=1 Tax=Nonomuraea sp. NEAU-A123 TaxID=2839649 RepID=UPI0027E008A7|nr:hypothetical protein [Nonomuraea sp. NEAU-A123]